MSVEEVKLDSHDLEETPIAGIQEVDRANRVCVLVLLDFIKGAVGDEQAHHSD